MVRSIRVDLANECDGEAPVSVIVHCDDPGCRYEYTHSHVIRVMYPDKIG